MNNQSDFTDVHRNVEALRGGTPFPLRGRAGDGVIAWNEVIKTPITHIIAISQAESTGLEDGEIITIYNQNGLCCGAAIFNTENLVITAFGDDPSTPVIDGMVEGEPMQFRVFNPETGKEFPLTVEFGNQMPQGGYFVNHGLSVVKSMQATGIGEVSELDFNISVYPNPSSGIFEVSTLSVLPAGGLTEFGWEISNTHGSIIAKGNNQVNDFTIDISSHPKGIYYLKITQGGLQTVKKLILQ
jgi:hypothetical protein